MQEVTPGLLGILDRAYRQGQLIGTPLAEDAYGKPYADDFFSFIRKLGLRTDALAIEIGAGVGYLTRRLKDAGLQIIGIEPGRGYAPHWDKYGVEVVNDFFPSPRVSGVFDLICSYAVLEHIAEPVKFLKDVRDHLAPEGVAVFSVPDCTEEIVTGDPAILFHEHFSYFEAGSLTRLIESVGMHAVVVKSGFGRCLYAIASLKAWPSLIGEQGVDRELVASYPERCGRFVTGFRQKISNMVAQGTVGVYCATRGLALLDRAWPMRFFDDDPALQGKFLPPFSCRIEGLDSLISRPVHTVLVMSRTFGERIRKNLKVAGYKGPVLTLDELG